MTFTVITLEMDENDKKKKVLTALNSRHYYEFWDFFWGGG